MDNRVMRNFGGIVRDTSGIRPQNQGRTPGYMKDFGNMISWITDIGMAVIGIYTGVKIITEVVRGRTKK